MCAFSSASLHRSLVNAYCALPDACEVPVVVSWRCDCPNWGYSWVWAMAWGCMVNNMKSDNLSELAAALCKAQAEMGGAVKSASNPFFKSSYADLTSVIKAIKEPFANNGLSYAQFPVTSEGGNGVGVKTILMHESGQYLESEFFLPLTKADPQAGGSAITYARRYALQAMAGLPTADDDAEAAMMRGKPEPTHEERCALAVDRNKDSLKYIRDSLAVNTAESVHYAIEAWRELDNDSKHDLWLAPTKGGWFTTQERKLLKEGFSGA